MYDWDDNGAGDDTGVADHVGYVTGLVGDTIHIIEGNCSNAVRRTTRQVNGRFIRGYCLPDYDAAAGNEPVTEEPTEENPSEPEPDTYTVKPGDSLWAIAWDHHMTSTELARINGIDPNAYIYPGQVLKLREDAPEEPEPVEPAPPRDDVYTVEPGDTLWGIAQKTMGKGWKWWRIAEANGLQDPYVIYPGQELVIPKGGD
jgi:LysM repeat protein